MAIADVSTVSGQSSLCAQPKLAVSVPELDGPHSGSVPDLR